MVELWQLVVGIGAAVAGFFLRPLIKPVPAPAPAPGPTPAPGPAPGPVPSPAPSPSPSPLPPELLLIIDLLRNSNSAVLRALAEVLPAILSMLSRREAMAAEKATVAMFADLQALVTQQQGK
jgi:hypothetical protein